MPVSVTMPRLGESVTEGTVTRWLKQEGERVEVDEPLLEVSTDKVDTEIPSPAAGVLSRIVVGEDETAEVGSELALIADEGEAGDAPATEAPAEQAADAPAEQQDAEAPAAAAQETAEDDAAPAQSGGAPAQASSGDQPAAGGAATGTAVRMPALGESVTEGTVTRWLKQVGESVEVDEPLLEVSTDKVDTEIPSPVAGTLLEIKVAEDDTAAVGADLAVIGASDGGGSSPAPQDAAPQDSPAQDSPAPAGGAEQASGAAQPAPGASYGTPSPQDEAQSAQPDQAQSTQPDQAQSTQPDQAQSAQPDQAQSAQAAPPRQETPAQPAARQAQQPAAQQINGEAGYVTPLVRKLAADRGVDLASLSGTGVGGRIRKQDVLDAAERAKAEAEAAAARSAAAPQAAAPRAAASQQPSPLRGRTEKMSRMRSLIARRMVESLQVSAQLTTVVEVDVTKIARLRDRAKADFLATHGAKLSFLPFFALAAVEALRVHPTVNASIDMEAGTVTYHDAEHLGMAVDSERGLVVPVIHNAGDLNLAGLAKRIADVAARTRTNKLSPDEISGGTFTLTNTGSRGALFDTPIINQPQVAILGTGAVVKRAVVVDDPNLGELILPRSMVYLALSYDHRLVDGADAARFLTTMKERLEGGNFESELGLA